MQYILSLLPVLACPLGMGLMMWMMMRGKKGQTPQETGNRGMETQDDPPVQRANESPKRSSIFSLFGMCLDWKVLAGLAVVGLVVWVIAPRFLLAAIPLLIVAACPLSMLFMMGRMRSGGRQVSTDAQPTHGERLATLKGQQEALSAQIAEMEHSEIPIISEAQSGARSADERERTRSGSRNR